MKKFFIESRMLGKSLSLTLILLLAVNCQTDESADIRLKENLPTEGIDLQSQARAREIVESKEYQSLMNHNKSFIGKIHSEKFYTEDLFDLENETYHYDVIRERLSMTSFESAEEFVQETEKTYYLAKALVEKFPELTNASSEFQELIKQESLKKIDSSESRFYSSQKNKCRRLHDACLDGTLSDYLWTQGGCVVFFAISPIGFALCTAIAIGQEISSLYNCKRLYNICMED